MSGPRAGLRGWSLVSLVVWRQWLAAWRRLVAASRGLEAMRSSGQCPVVWRQRQHIARSGPVVGGVLLEAAAHGDRLLQSALPLAAELSLVRRHHPPALLALDPQVGASSSDRLTRRMGSSRHACSPFFLTTSLYLRREDGNANGMEWRRRAGGGGERRGLGVWVQWIIGDGAGHDVAVRPRGAGSSSLHPPSG
jgi:hypothetical protein